MVKTRILLLGENNGYLDCKDGSSFNINFSIGDIRDLSKRNGNYSNTVTIVGNSNSHNLLNHYYDVNIQAGTFNVNTLQKCLVEQDGVVILDNMYMQLTGVKKIQKTGAYEEQVEYTVEIKDSSADFFVKISNLELTDISLSAFNHTYSTSAVTESFNNTWEDGYKYLMPYIDNSTTFSIQDFKPGVYHRIYWDKIFDAAGFTYEFEEASGSTIHWNKLFIPYNGDVPKPGEDESSWVIADKLSAVTETFQGSVNNSLVQIILDNQIQDTLDYYNPITGEYTMPYGLISPDSLNFEFIVNYDISVQNNNATSVTLFGPGGTPKNYGIKLATNSNSEIGNLFAVPANTTILAGASYVLATNFEESIDVNISNLNTGDIIKTFIGRYEQTINAQRWQVNSSPSTFRYVDTVITVNSITVTIKPSLETFVPGSSLSLNTFIPKKIKQSDYVKSICQMFNAYIETDRNNPTNLIIKTRDKFYDDGVVVDWTQKLAKDKEQNIKFLPELSSKRLILSYKPDKDTANANYESITNEVYGQVEYIFDNEYVKNVEKRELIFSPTPNAYTSFGANVPLIIGQAPKTNLRILLDNGLYSCFPYTINENGTPSTTEYSVYPLLSHFDDAENPTFDINFAKCDYYFYNPDSLTNNNLYNLHYRRTLSQINNGKLLSAYFNLNSVDIQQMRMNDKIRIDNSYWNINKLTYDANSSNLTLVELISVDDELELVDLKTFGISSDNMTGNVILPSPGDTLLQGLGNLKNNIGKSKIDYSNLDASNGNVKFNGLFNQTGNYTKGFVQGDYNQVPANGTVYVDGNNNIINSPSFIYGSNVLVDENLENVSILRSNFTATTSDTTYVNRLNANLITGATSASTQTVGINSLGELVAVEANYFDSASDLVTFDGTVSQCADYAAGTPTGVAFNHTANNVPVGTFKVTFTSIYRLGASTLAGTSKGVFRLYMDGVAISNPLYVSDIGVGTNTTYTYYTFITTTTLANRNFQVRVACDFDGCGGDTTTFNILSTNWDIQQNGIATGQITPSWSDVLYNGNSSGPYDVIISSISPASSGATIMMREQTGVLTESIFTEADLIQALSGGTGTGVTWSTVLSNGNESGGINPVLTSGSTIGGGEDPSIAVATNILYLGDSTVSDGTWYLGDRDANLSEIRFDGTDSHFENAAGDTRINGNNIRLDSAGEVFIVNQPLTGSSSANILVRETGGEVREISLTGITSSSANTWSQVLTNGNTSGPNDAIIDTTQVIKSGNGGGQLDLDSFGSPNTVLLSTDNSAQAESYLYLDSSQLILLNNSFAGFAANTTTASMINGIGTGIYAKINQLEGGISGNTLFNFGDGIDSGINGNDRLPGIISSKDSQFNLSVVNSVILGGSNITGVTSDTVYVPYLNVGIVGTGTSITSLGVDSSGNVVSGTAGSLTPFKRNTTAALTGTLSETLITSTLIPAGTFQSNDWLRWTVSTNCSNNANAKTFRAYFNTSASLVGATQIAQRSLGNTVSQVVGRNMFFPNSLTTIRTLVGATLNTADDYGATGTASALSIDFTVDQYFIISGQLANSGDTMTVNGFTSQINR